MNRVDVITFRVSKKEQELLVKLAQFLQRSRSDAIRFVLVQVTHRLENDPVYRDWLMGPEFLAPVPVGLHQDERHVGVKNREEVPNERQ